MDGTPGKDGSKGMPVRLNKKPFYVHFQQDHAYTSSSRAFWGGVIDDYIKNVVLMFIQGEQGDDGETGLSGKAGSRGKTGIPGLPGEQGTIGPKVKAKYRSSVRQHLKIT